MIPGAGRVDGSDKNCKQEFNHMMPKLHRIPPTTARFSLANMTDAPIADHDLSDATALTDAVPEINLNHKANNMTMRIRDGLPPSPLH